uniref:SH2 motif and Tyrosine protein kinase domain containing protein n=1 Tax=Haemonchus contortus TaxID=6289 RepID=W6NTJ2_HAECO
MGPSREKDRRHSQIKSEVSTDTHVTEGLDKDEERILKEFEFYHGFLPREDLFCLLKYVGEFLIRVSEVDNDPHQKGKREIILSVVCECAPGETSRIQNIDEKEDEAQGKKGYEKKVRGKLKNVIVRRKNGKYLVEVARLFESIPQLIKHYRETPGKLNKISFILKYPIKQQSWEYNHSDVQQGKLLGEGAFGEVRAGTLKLKSGRIAEVAIKVIQPKTITYDDIKLTQTRGHLPLHAVLEAGEELCLETCDSRGEVIKEDPKERRAAVMDEETEAEGEFAKPGGTLSITMPG